MGFENLSGRSFGQYELRELMGVGGMGAVYRAYQAGLDREVAVKVLPRALAAESGYIERFIREARTAALLEHPHIVRIYDYGTQGDISYLVMALLRGGSLSQRLANREETKRSSASLGEVAAMLNQIASALDYAHHEGVLHRDIKPANIMFDSQGRSYLTDFGIAKLMGATTALTGTGVAMGSPSYMPPEQWAGQDLGPAADQYALGVTIYQTIAGRLPFEADSAAQLMYKHFHEEPTPLSVTRGDIPTALMIVLNRAMAKSPESRFPNITQFAQSFESAIEGNMGEPTGFFQYKLKPERPRPSGAQPTPFGAEVPRTPSNTGNSIPPASGQYQMTNPPPQQGSGTYTPQAGYTPPQGGYTPQGGYSGQTPPGNYPPGQTPSGFYAPGNTPPGGYTAGYPQQQPKPFYRSPVAIIGGIAALAIIALLAIILLRPQPDNTEAVLLTLTAAQAQAATNAEGTRVAAIAATETPQPEATETQALDATATDQPTDSPTDAPTDAPTNEPTDAPTEGPTEAVLAITETPEPSATPTDTPTATETPTDAPTETPTERPTNTATFTPSHTPTETLTNTPEFTATFTPTPRPSNTPTEEPSLTPEPQPAARLSLGDVASDEIDDSRPEVLFEYEGTAGEVLDITVAVTDGNLDPSLYLVGPSGEEIAKNDDISGTDRNAALEQTELPQDGVYTIRIVRYRGARGNSEGTFELAINASGGLGEEILWDEPVTGEITDDEWQHEYTFEGTANQVVSIQLWATNGNPDDNLDPYLKLLNPDGTLLEDNDDAVATSRDSGLIGVTLWQDGTYTIVATRYREETGNSTGTFELLLTEGAAVDPNCPDDTLTIGCPAYVSDTIDRPVNVRVEPRAGGDVVTAAEAGTPVTILDGPRAAEGFIWWQVRLEDGSEGWMVARIGFNNVLIPGVQ
jgi:serine/threonine protein kinase